MAIKYVRFSNGLGKDVVFRAPEEWEAISMEGSIWEYIKSSTKIEDLCDWFSVTYTPKEYKDKLLKLEKFAEDVALTRLQRREVEEMIAPSKTIVTTDLKSLVNTCKEKDIPINDIVGGVGFDNHRIIARMNHGHLSCVSKLTKEDFS